LDEIRNNSVKAEQKRINTVVDLANRIIVNPKAEVHVRWTYAWYGPDKAREAAEALIAEGCDALAFAEDTPAVIEVGQEEDSFRTPLAHYSPMQPYGKDSVVSGQLVDWGVMYEKILKDLHEGVWKSDDQWWLVAEKAAIPGGSFDEPINSIFVDDLKAVTVATTDFGTLRIKAGEKASKEDLLGIMYYVDNVVGTIPK
jgi:simple sugar transport system substrate-binding protein